MHVFAEVTGLRENWLHRGCALAGMDLQQYNIDVERVRLPRLMARKPDASNVFAYGTTRRLANSCCQQFAAWPHTLPRPMWQRLSPQRHPRRGGLCVW